MTGYSVIFMAQALEDMAALDAVVAQRILSKIAWLGQNFENLVHEPLSGELKGLFKLRVGSYRVLYSANTGARLVAIHAVGHRRDIYR